MIRIYVGYDIREAAAYHVFCQSVLDHASVPVSFIPLHRPMLAGFDGQRDGSNAFIYSRYLVPYLENFNGWGLFCDGDMVVRRDIKELWDMRWSYIDNKAVAVVKHDYLTQHKRKYKGSPLESDNLDYPRKNWSSVMLWHCGHYANRILTPEFVGEASGDLLHRFQWLQDHQIGELPSEWNHLVMEYKPNRTAALAHFTLGVPGFPAYNGVEHSAEWMETYLRAAHLEGVDPEEMTERALYG